MTKEEALVKVRGYLTDYLPLDNADEIDEIIKALAQQPLENCISKEEVINAIHKTIYEFFDIADDVSEEPMNDKDKLLLTINKALSNAVKALPSVTPSRPKGHWIEHPHECGDNWQYPKYECSKCHTWVEYDDDFCPGCGADMTESEKEK